jgi:hypothetical protein
LTFFKSFADIGFMKLEDVPDAKGLKYPHRVTLCLSDESKLKIKRLKEAGKDPSAFFRKLIEDALNKIPV